MNRQRIMNTSKENILLQLEFYKNNKMHKKLK